MIDLAIAKQAYRGQEVENIAFISTEYNPADVLTKVDRCSILEYIIREAKIDHPIEQWVE